MNFFRLVFRKADKEKHGLIYSVLITNNNEERLIEGKNRVKNKW
jgi:hypothetical protein